MNTGGDSGTDIFDTERLRRLIELMEAHDLSEVDLQQGSDKIKLRRGVEMAAPTPVAARSVAAIPIQGAAATVAADGPTIVTIKAPMVGTFYNRANPQAEPFVKVGQRVTPESTICIIEAMKVFNEIPAEMSGVVTAVLIDAEQPVDFGRPLFKVDTAG